jgi:hypothetical protein
MNQQRHDNQRRKLRPEPRQVDGQGHVDPRKPLDPTSDEPNYEWECEVCGQIPVHPLTGMCGPCTFGEADTVGGNW